MVQWYIVQNYYNILAKKNELAKLLGKVFV